MAQGKKIIKKSSPKVKVKKKKFFSALNPANLSIIENVEATDLSQVREFFKQARMAQEEWAQTPIVKRKRHIEALRNYILENTDELADIINQNNGKTRIDALISDIMPSALACKWYADNAPRVMRPKRIPLSSFMFMTKKSYLLREALGIVAIISPWNYPLSIPMNEILMALITGNGVMLKVSNSTILIGKAIEKIIAAGEFPEGLFHHIIGSGSAITNEFIKNDIDKIFFTGSVRTGREILKKASEKLIPVSLELGGKDPMIVLDDANLERATSGACWAGYHNSGQSCAGVERVYVQEKVYDKFIELLKRKTKSLRHGEEIDFNLDMGSMTTKEQLETVKKQLQEAVKKGAKIVSQSSAVGKSRGYLYPATLLTDVNHEMKIMKEETFGPVLPVMKFNTIEEAIQLANDSSMALSSSIWTKDTELAKKIASRLQSGTITINDHLYTHGQTELPFGGWKESGMGRTHSTMGLEAMTRTKVVNWDALPLKRNFWWYPFDESSFRDLKAALEVSFPRGPIRFLKNLIILKISVIRKMMTSWKTD